LLKPCDLQGKIITFRYNKAHVSYGSFFVQLNKKIILFQCWLALVICLTTHLAHAEEETLPDWKSDTLTGDWNGLRGTLYKTGVDVGLTHKSDFLANVSGGLKRGSAWIGHSEIRAEFDLEKLLGWDATSAYFHYHSDLGSKFNTHYVGGIVGVDNIEVATNTAQFYHAWIQKKFFAEKLSVLFGLYPIDSEFYVTETSGLFLQPPYGMANELALTGANGPPIFPIGALATRVKMLSPNKNFYVQAALADGVPSDPDNQRGTHIKLGKHDGTLSIIELGYAPENTDEAAENFNKTALGFWRYSANFDDIDGLGGRSKSQGAYVLSEQSLFHESGSKTQGLTGFVRFGVASKEVNALDWTGSLGLRYRGLVAGRDDDIAGLAVTLNHAGNDFRNSGNFNRQETDLELTYRVQIKPWLAVQPTIQGIINPGLDPSIKDAWIIGTRVEIEL
jgi:porin